MTSVLIEVVGEKCLSLEKKAPPSMMVHVLLVSWIIVWGFYISVWVVKKAQDLALYVGTPKIQTPDQPKETWKTAPWIV